MKNTESFVAVDARLEKLETRLLRIERRLHLDAPANIMDTLPATPPSPPVAQTPASFAPPIIVSPTPPAPETKPQVQSAVFPAPQTVVSVPEIPLPSSIVPQTTQPTTAQPTPTLPITTQPTTAQPTPTLPITTQSQPQTKPDKSLLDWEQLVGGKWALWAGLLSIFGAIASFLAYTWRFLPPPPPEAKVAMGFFAGVAFLVAGEWTRKRAQNWFSEGLAGAGLSICFLSLWAGGAYFSIFSFGFTFGAMAVICALGVWLAVRTDALSLNILSIIGGFLTPILLRGDGGGAGDATVLLLSYIAVINAGVLGVALFKRWRASTWLSLGATVTLLLFWSQNANVTTMRPTVFAFISVYFLLYLATACFNSLARREETAPEEIGLIVVATTLYAPLAHDLLWPVSGAFPGAFALGFALFWAALCALTARLAPTNRTLRDVTGALGILAFTVAIPIQIAQPWLGIALAGEAATLAWLARRSHSELLRRGGQIVWCLSLFPLAAAMLTAAADARFGLHAGGWPLLFGVAVTAYLAWSAHRETENADELRDIYARVAVAGGAWLVARETLARGWAPESAGMALAFYALAVFVLGARLRFNAVRDSGLALALGVSILLALRSWVQLAPEVLPLFNAPFVALILAASAFYALAWRVRRDKNETLHRCGQVLWATASLPLVVGMLLPAHKAQLGLHAGGWPWLFALLAAAAFAWSAHRETENADELRDFYAFVAVAGGAWLVARETLAWTSQPNLVWIALAIYAVATFAVGARARFSAVRLCALALGAGAAAASLWLAWQNFAPELTPFWNARFSAMFAAIGALGAIYQLAKTIDFPLHPAEKAAARAFPLGAVSLVLAAFSTELYFGFAHFAAPQWVNRAFFALSIGWNLAALSALSIGLRTRHNVWRVWTYLVGGAALASLPLNALANAAVWMPFANWRFAAFAVAVAVSGVAAYLLHSARKDGVIEAPETDAIAAATGAALGLALFSLTHETWEMSRYLAPAGSDWQRGAQMAISLVWSLFGALLLAAGAQFRVQVVRLGALGLLAFTVCKVFLFDLSFLDGAGRALSLGGLGVALVFISWLYGRFGRASVPG